MKKFLYIVICLAALTSCGGGNEVHVSRESMEKIKRHGISDAEKVIAANDSMEQERLMLEIRATEQRIKQAGNQKAARAYIEAAEATLKQANIIK